MRSVNPERQVVSFRNKKRGYEVSYFYKFNDYETITDFDFLLIFLTFFENNMCAASAQ